MNHTALYAYPWDLAPHDGCPAGIGADLADLGVDTLVLAASYHAGRFLRPRTVAMGGPAVVMPEDGTVYFEPDLTRYGRLKPLKARGQQGDPFRKPPAGLRLEAWTVLLHNSRLGEANTDLVVRNAFGDPYPHALCPSRREVGDYAAALCADLGRTGVQGLRIETPGWSVYRHGHHHEFDQTGLNPWVEALLGLCFCGGCQSEAHLIGLDLEPVRQRVQGHIRAFLASPAQPSTDMALGWLVADLLEDDDLRFFLKWRRTLVTSLVARIRAELPKDVALRVIATCQRPHAMALLEGHDLAGLARACDQLELPLYQPTPELVEADLWDVLRRGELPHPPSVILRPGPPDMGSEGQLRDTLRRVKDLGVRDLAFYNLGLLRPVHLDWLRRSLTAIP